MNCGYVPCTMLCTIVPCTMYRVRLFIDAGTLLKSWDTNTNSVVNQSKYFCIMDGDLQTILDFCFQFYLAMQSVQLRMGILVRTRQQQVSHWPLQ